MAKAKAKGVTIERVTYRPDRDASVAIWSNGPSNDLYYVGEILQVTHGGRWYKYTTTGPALKPYMQIYPLDDKEAADFVATRATYIYDRDRAAKLTSAQGLQMPW